jgi:DNA anti-recombination protein RmuC
MPKELLVGGKPVMSSDIMGRWRAVQRQQNAAAKNYADLASRRNAVLGDRGQVQKLRVPFAQKRKLLLNRDTYIQRLSEKMQRNSQLSAPLDDEAGYLSHLLDLLKIPTQQRVK